MVAGRARFRLGDEHVDAGPGTIVAVPDPTELRGYRALEPGTRIVCHRRRQRRRGRLRRLDPARPTRA